MLFSRLLNKLMNELERTTLLLLKLSYVPICFRCLYQRIKQERLLSVGIDFSLNPKAYIYMSLISIGSFKLRHRFLAPHVVFCL
jgi:hypothetical protein